MEKEPPWARAAASARVTVEPMTTAHVPRIAELERLCFPDPWTEGMIAAELDNPLSLWLVGLSGGVVAGYAGAQSVLDEADVMNLAVAPEHRREGLASMLLRELEKRLFARGVRRLFLEVRPTNESALALYRREGFNEAGRRKNYYLHPKEDALILRKELDG